MSGLDGLKTIGQQAVGGTYTVPTSPRAVTTSTGKDPRFDTANRGPTTGATIPTEDAPGASSTVASLAEVLTDFGLEELIPIVDKWVRSGLSAAEVMLQLRDPSTAAGKIFDARFPAIQMRKQAGLAPISPQDYVAYERQARQLFSAAGMPVGFYDSRSDFTNLIAGDVSPAELSARVNDGFAKVANAPTAVRDAFKQFFGANGDAALASFFLDQNRALPLLQKQVAAAETGGAAREFGFQTSLDRSMKIADTGVSYSQARAGFGALSDLKPVFAETISEARDLSAEVEGVDAAFSLDQGQAKKAITDRVGERTAAMAGVGGAAVSEKGVVGLGTART